MNQTMSPASGAVAGAGLTGLQMAATLSEEREAIFRRLLGGTPPAEVVASFTDFADGLIAGRYRNVVRSGAGLTEAGLRDCCLVALGGYGRRELFPYSDIDVMLLYRREAAGPAAALSSAVLHHLWDVGFHVGHSIRTFQDCLELGLSDLTVRTSMMEARFLAGSPELFQEFHHRFTRKIVSRGIDHYLDQKVEERRREYQKFGETVYLLEPNVKRSKGGLRDLHLLQWVGLARYGAPTIRELTDRGILSAADHRTLKDAREFLWRIRMLLHARAGQAQEILTFDEQVWLAQHFGFRDQPHLLAVEQFMQQYYRHTAELHSAAMRFIDRSRRTSVWSRLKAWVPPQRLDTYFVIKGKVLDVPKGQRSQVLESPVQLVKLFDLSRSKGLPVEASLLEDIHRHSDGWPESGFRMPEVNQIFRAILNGPRTATTLEVMHRARVLERLVPAFATVRGLMQFNQYHKYTVDEHSLLAVAKAEQLTTDQGVLGDAYRQIRRKDLLHLAVLLHDLGKGHEEDHSEVGKRLAEQAASQFGYDEQDRRTLVFLVYRHLLMAHTAFRRDPYDEKVLLSFAREVGTPDMLRKLLILTAADIAAVGPGVLTKWKESLLVELYLQTLPKVSGERIATDAPGRLKQIALEVVSQTAGGSSGIDETWVTTQLQQFPLRYAYGTVPRRIATHLAAVRRLHAEEVIVECDYDDELGTCEYAVITHNDIIPGLFSKIAGVMAANGLQILDAQILTRPDGVIVDTFQVVDPDYTGAPPEDRRWVLSERIATVVKGWEDIDDVMRRGARLKITRSLPMARQPTEVHIDHETSDAFTIIDVFADDQQGLLYVITNAIFRLGLSVHAARISTRLDQVADVFYVTDQQGRKVEDHTRLEHIRQTILRETEAFLKAKAA